MNMQNPRHIFTGVSARACVRQRKMMALNSKPMQTHWHYGHNNNNKP